MHKLHLLSQLQLEVCQEGTPGSWKNWVDVLGGRKVGGNVPPHF